MSLDDDGDDSDQPPDRAVYPPDDSYSLSKKHALLDAAFKLDEYRNARIASKSSLKHRKPVESAPLAELVSVVRSLGQEFLRVEQMKLQMQSENERLRADMEMRRTEMVLKSQKEIVDSFTRALASSKKGKKPPTSGV